MPLMKPRSFLMTPLAVAVALAGSTALATDHLQDKRTKPAFTTSTSKTASIDSAHRGTAATAPAKAAPATTPNDRNTSTRPVDPRRLIGEPAVANDSWSLTGDTNEPPTTTIVIIRPVKRNPATAHQGKPVTGTATPAHAASATTPASESGSGTKTLMGVTLAHEEAPPAPRETKHTHTAPGKGHHTARQPDHVNPGH